MPSKDLRDLVLCGRSTIYHTTLALIPTFSFTSNFPRGTIPKTLMKSYRKVKLQFPYTKFQLSCQRKVSDYSGAISQWENTITVFHLLFTFMTSIIIFFEIYSEGLQAIKIAITTFILSFFMNTQYGAVARCAELDWLTNEEVLLRHKFLTSL